MFSKKKKTRVKNKKNQNCVKLVYLDTRQICVKFVSNLCQIYQCGEKKRKSYITIRFNPFITTKMNTSSTTNQPHSTPYGAKGQPNNKHNKHDGDALAMYTNFRLKKKWAKTKRGSESEWIGHGADLSSRAAATAATATTAVAAVAAVATVAAGRLVKSVTQTQLM